MDDLESIDNDTWENKNKIVFLILLKKIATLIHMTIEKMDSTTSVDIGFSSHGKHLPFS